MKLARIRYNGMTHLARIDGEEAVLLSQESGGPGTDPLREALAASVDLAGDGRRLALGGVELLSPVANPSKIIGIGLNYADHAREAGAEAPVNPLMFVKTHNTICGPGDVISWSADSSAQVDYEAELAVVVGREASCVDGDPLDHVLGYTCCNDVSARDVQFGDGQWTLGKCLDGFLPIGPWIVTADEIADPQAVRLGCDVNSERRQVQVWVEGIGVLANSCSVSDSLAGERAR